LPWFWMSPLKVFRFVNPVKY